MKQNNEFEPCNSFKGACPVGNGYVSNRSSIALCSLQPRQNTSLIHFC